MSSRVVAAQLYIDWDFNGTYTLEPTVLISARGEMRLALPEAGINSGRGVIDTMSLTLRNTGGIFSPLRSSALYYNLIKNGGAYHAPCYLQISIDGGSNYDRVFTGVLKFPKESTLTSRNAPTVTFDCRADEERILQRRSSTTLADFATWHDDGATEATIIQALLVEALDLTLPADAARISIDPGIVAIPYVWLDDDSIVESLWELAGAVGGRYYADPDGVHHYENFTHWQIDTRATTVQHRYNKDEYQRLEAWYDDRDLYNEITIETSPLSEDYAAEAWTIEAPLLVYPGKTEVVTAELDEPIYSIDSVTWVARTLGGTDATASIAISPTYYAQRVNFSAVNSGSLLVAVSRLTITGRSIIRDASQSVKRTSTDDGTNAAFFTARNLARTRRIAGKRYIQSLAHAQSLAQYLLDRQEKPRLTFRLTGCPGDPELRLGDRIRIVDNDWQYQDGTGSASSSIMDDAFREIDADESISTPTTEGPVLIDAGVTVTVSSIWTIIEQGVEAYTIGVSWQFDNTGFKQTIDAIAVTDMFPYDGNYFVLNTAGHVIGSTKVVFY